MPDQAQITAYLHVAVAVLGTLYVLASLVAAVAPKTKVGTFCATIALDLSGFAKDAPTKITTLEPELLKGAPLAQSFIEELEKNPALAARWQKLHAAAALGVLLTTPPPKG